MNIDDLKEAKQYLRDNYEMGIDCPCCTQLVKKYRRSIYDKVALQLIKLYKFDLLESSYYHISQISGKKNETGGGDFAKLRFWELIKQMPKDPANTVKRTSGYWMITDKGKMFVEKKILVPKYVIILIGECLGLEGENISIETCLGDKFNYQELMNL